MAFFFLFDVKRMQHLGFITDYYIRITKMCFNFEVGEEKREYGS